MMKLGHCLLLTCIGVTWASLLPDAGAVALRPTKATDDSVCDLSHDTIGFLGGSMLIPSSARQDDQVDAYFRLGATFVAQKCIDGQLLIVQGMSSSQLAPLALQRITSSACTGATIARSEVMVPLAGRAFPGFELRCAISKRAELSAHLAQLEKSDPMAALKARLQAAAVDPANGLRDSVGSGNPRKDCDKVTLASLLQGGACRK